MHINTYTHTHTYTHTYTCNVLQLENIHCNNVEIIRYVLPNKTKLSNAVLEFDDDNKLEHFFDKLEELCITCNYYKPMTQQRLDTIVRCFPNWRKIIYEKLYMNKIAVVTQRFPQLPSLAACKLNQITHVTFVTEPK